MGYVVPPVLFWFNLTSCSQLHNVELETKNPLSAIHSSVSIFPEIMPPPPLTAPEYGTMDGDLVVYTLEI